MSPDELKAYFDVLPAGTCQIALKSGPFEISLNLAHPIGAGALEAIVPGAAEAQAVDKDGNLLPPGMEELFPHLVHRRQ